MALFFALQPGHSAVWFWFSAIVLLFMLVTLGMVISDAFSPNNTITSAIRDILEKGGYDLPVSEQGVVGPMAVAAITLTCVMTVTFILGAVSQQEWADLYPFAPMA
jgi:hypothetical protein